MLNIKFSYLYRDCGNFKTFGYIVLSNHFKLSLESIRKQLLERLIDETWFYAEQWGIPILYDGLSNEDPTWHEFESIEYTDEKGRLDIGDFLRMIYSA